MCKLLPYFFFWLENCQLVDWKFYGAREIVKLWLLSMTRSEDVGLKNSVLD